MLIYYERSTNNKFVILTDYDVNIWIYTYMYGVYECCLFACTQNFVFQVNSNPNS